MNPSACPSLTATVESGTWYRAIQPQFLQTALSTSQTAQFPSRFNFGAQSTPQFEVLYLAENPMVALFEVQALLGSPYTPGGVVPHPRRAWMILNVVVNLQAVADLTDPQSQSKVQTSAQELTGDWRGYSLRGTLTSVKSPTGVAPTQELGAALYAAPSIEGFRVLSAKLTDQMVLVIFPQKLNPGSTVTFFDHHTGQSHSLTSPAP